MILLADCSDLVCHFEGFYWIDPNLGISNDAVLVHCDMTAGGHTCIEPNNQTRSEPLAFHKRERQQRWFSSHSNGYQIEYDQHCPPVQMNFLRLLSTEAYQSFTYKCINSAAWYSETLRSFDYAIRFMGQNHQEFSLRSAIKPEVLSDGCKAKSMEASETQFRFATSKTSALPLVDFWPTDYGFGEQQFGFKFGSVCFY